MNPTPLLFRLLVAVLLTAAPAAAVAGETLERRIGVMGTSLTVEVAAPDRARALAASEAAVRAVEAAERRLSTWKSDSELAAVNAAVPGVAFPVSPALRRELAAARACAADTEGAFEASVGPLVAAWDLRGAGRVPPADVLREARAGVGADGWRLVQAGVVRNHGAVQLEEGGFGKGAALDAARDALRAGDADSAVLDLGGQVLAMGTAVDVPLAHPAQREVAVATFSIDGGSLAVSGNSERGLRVDGRAVGHILDPRTGMPAPFTGSVAVWVPGGTAAALRADCLATAFFVHGPAATQRLLVRMPDVHVLFLEPVADGVRIRSFGPHAGRLRESAAFRPAAPGDR